MNGWIDRWMGGFWLTIINKSVNKERAVSVKYVECERHFAIRPDN